jgi:hypothetical protein
MLLVACGQLASQGGDGGSVVVPDAGDSASDSDGITARDATSEASKEGSVADATSEISTADAADDGATDAGDGGWIDTCGHKRPDVFADEVISFNPGPTAGFGQSAMPCVVLGPPQGLGAAEGSVDVASLGDMGSIVLRFDDVELVDQPGPDLIVFENAIAGFAEPGFVAVSADGSEWYEWPCEPQNADAGYPYCAGIHPVYSNPDNGISPTDVDAAGGDDFDLADLGVTRVRYVRIRDSGFSHYGGTTGGFDLDAIAAVHSIPND